ncbi:Protein DOG1-like 4 [Camellia lanceoleosa]|uniref:Protein DOG1-like 4 n=1 Tax=Camellia lanceoleosa TaxID=1840588 RepID=A0ACC0GGM5_9ERIC|nr:Protein DOG1-like 4 [Camellia lanceoleosa]
MKTQVEERFSDFFEKWVCQLELHLQLLLKISKESSNESDFKTVVAKLTAHHKDYYTAKWASAHEDVLAFFVPVWLSPLENAYLWFTGWKPSMAFQLVNSLRVRVPGSSLADMSESQLRKVEELKGKIRVEEEKVEREMERQQVAMADRRMVELARLTSRVKSGGGNSGGGGVAAEVDGLVEAAVKGLLGGLEKVMKMADCVRLKTLKGLLEVLNPIQCVDFLVATSMLQIQMRRWGRKRESSQSHSSRRHESQSQSQSQSQSHSETCAMVQFV